MKKILIVHTKYRLKGGEDIAVENEIKFLEKHFDIETLIFSNETKNSLKQIMSLFLSYDKESYEQLNKKISNFDPELIYFHNILVQLLLSKDMLQAMVAIPITKLYQKDAQMLSKPTWLVKELMPRELIPLVSGKLNLLTITILPKEEESIEELK